LRPDADYVVNLESKIKETQYSRRIGYNFPVEEKLYSMPLKPLVSNLTMTNRKCKEERYLGDDFEIVTSKLVSWLHQKRLELKSA